MEFLILAYDGRDAQAKERRLRVREAHLSEVRRLKEKGHFIAGGAILSETGEMIGSTLYMDFPSRADLETWLHADPYVTQGVWIDIKIEPIRLVMRN